MRVTWFQVFYIAYKFEQNSNLNQKNNKKKWSDKWFITELCVCTYKTKKVMLCIHIIISCVWSHNNNNNKQVVIQTRKWKRKIHKCVLCVQKKMYI